MGTPDGGANERWRKRKTEQLLASQLSAARERYRLAKQAAQELSAAEPRHEAQTEGSLSQATQELAEALQVLTGAEREWINFVSAGVIPSDIDER